MSKLAKALSAAAGNAGGTLGYVEDVFSTYLYTGTASAITINNGIDLSGEGGLTWLKSRNLAEADILMDTTRGVSSALVSNNTNAPFTLTDGITAFNSNGFTLGTSNIINTNNSTNTSWTFRKAEKFFDVVTWTGDGTGGPFTLPHNLGATVGMSVVKVTSHSGEWITNHRSLPSNYLALNSTAAAQTDVTMTSTDSTITFNGSSVYYNFSGRTYVAYLFASEAGGYGDDGTENIIKCGSFNSTALTNLGWEPQWVMMKRTDSTSGWFMVDDIRGMTASTNTTTYNGTSQYLYANTNGTEAAGIGLIAPAATGFGSGQSGTYIYIAIRRPMKTPEAGTEVFAPVGATTTAPLWKSSFPVDMGWYRYIIGTSASTYIGSRLTGTGRLQSSSTAAEATDGSFIWDYMNGWFDNSFNDTNYVGYNFKRAAGFMDVVCYTGTGSFTPLPHNLTVPPELFISKARSATGGWTTIYSTSSLGATSRYVSLDTNAASGNWGNAALTATTFGLSQDTSGVTYVNYLFATLAGISKVGSYTGTGAGLNVDCGFTGGARFILIKRTDATGDWYTYDSFRGITAGNDPYLLLNTTAAQVTNTDYIDPLNAGFTVTSSAPAGLNASGGNYIFLAIA